MSDKIYKNQARGGEWMKEKYEGYINVFISADEMSADIFFVSAPESGFYDVDEIVRYVNMQGIKEGIDREVIESSLVESKYGEFIPFASGILPTEPKDGYFEFYFNTKPSKNPKTKEDGSVDYYNLNLVEVVGEGQVLAEYNLKEDGTDGITVKGKILPAKKAKDMPPLRGKGFTISEDGKIYYAEHDGKVDLNLGHLNVSDIYMISGDVDLSTGNINFRGDLHISGNITSEMQVKATGNITVDGLVEAANIETGKGLLVKGGILGGGKAQIKAGDNVYAQFIENAVVESNNCVQADSIINSKIIAYQDINVFGKTSCIIGGYIKANRCIRTKIIGSDKGVTTSLEVGINIDCMIERKRTEENLTKLEQDLEKVEKLIDNISKAGKEKSDVFLQATRTKIELTAEVFRLRSLLNELTRQMEVGKDAEIIAEDKVFAGVNVIIDGVRHNVVEDYETIKFFRKGPKIVSKKCEPEDQFVIS